MSRPAVESIADWVAQVQFEDLPGRVVERLKVQTIGMFGATFAGLQSDAGPAVCRTVRRRADQGEGVGPCTAIATGGRLPLHEALFENSALSMTFDYDDYLFMGHTGHSAVYTPLAVAEAWGKHGKDFLLAAAIANEVEGRLGASVLLGPHNGQLWAFIHAAGSACAAAKLFGLNADGIANALGIALYLPPYSMMPGFMGPTSKITSAAVPSVNGLRAAELAAEGVTGARTILEDSQGFLRAFAYVPLKRMLTGFGRSWVTDSLCFKAYPGCAYVSSLAEALRQSLAELKAGVGERMDPGEIESVTIRATLLTLGMDGLSRPYAVEPPTSVHVNFSSILSAAVTLLHGDLRPKLLSGERLRAEWNTLRSLAGRIQVVHDWDLTVDLTRGIAQGVNLGPLFARIPLSQWNHLRRMARRQHRVSLAGIRPRHVLAMLKTARRSGGKAPFDLGDARFEDLRMNFASAAKIRLKSGRTAEASVPLPPGSSGRPWEETVALMEEKFRSESSGALSAQTIAAVLKAVKAAEVHEDVREMTRPFHSKVGS